MQAHGGLPFFVGPNLLECIDGFCFCSRRSRVRRLWQQSETVVRRIPGFAVRTSASRVVEPELQNSRKDPSEDHNHENRPDVGQQRGGESCDHNAYSKSSAYWTPVSPNQGTSYDLVIKCHEHNGQNLAPIPEASTAGLILLQQISGHRLIVGAGTKQFQEPRGDGRRGLVFHAFLL